MATYMKKPSLSFLHLSSPEFTQLGSINWVTCGYTAGDHSLWKYKSSCHHTLSCQQPARKGYGFENYFINRIISTDVTKEGSQGYFKVMSIGT